MYAKEILLFIEKVYKYLIIKKKHAQIMLYFLHREYYDSGKHFHDELKVLNRSRHIEHSENARKAKVGTEKEISQ